MKENRSASQVLLASMCSIKNTIVQQIHRTFLETVTKSLRNKNYTSANKLAHYNSCQTKCLI